VSKPDTAKLDVRMLISCRVLLDAVWLQADPQFPLMSPGQKQSVIHLARCLAGQPHLLDWVQRQVGGWVGA
jgi:hypothetical protein